MLYMLYMLNGSYTLSMFAKRKIVENITLAESVVMGSTKKFWYKQLLLGIKFIILGIYLG